mmetsp:Transcript_40947/g.92328  ORF Transcript_40947/g.92328 Transcript_40947/m.92328 type:complete len:224 (+) Transcript_40947:175-846(+)
MKGIHNHALVVAEEEEVVHQAADRTHGQAAVLKLLQLHLLRGPALAQVHGVKAEEPRLAFLVLKHVEHGHLALVLGELQEAAEQEDLSQGLGTDHGERLNWVGALVGGPGQVHRLRHQEAHHREHGHTAVLELSLTHPFDVEGVGEAEGVEALVADHAGGVLGRGQERHGLAHLHRSGGGGTLLGHIQDIVDRGLAAGLEGGSSGGEGEGESSLGLHFDCRGE